MDLSRIEKLLGPESDVDLQALYAQFCETEGTDGLDRFLIYLHARGHVESGTLTWVADAEAVSRTRSAPEDHTIVLGDPKSGDAVRLRRRAPRGERFKVIETIGEGGMGSIALARDESLQRYVAYKRLHGEHATTGAAVDRFDFEAQVTAQLDHPNIVPVYSYDAGQGYAMKLVAGRTLTQVLDEARRQRGTGDIDADHSLAGLLEVFLKVCDAIHYAHSKAVVHRDLKPDNILVGRFSEVYVVDWGIAKLLGDPTGDGEGETTVRLEDATAEAHPETQQGDLLGTPGYMSPEQVKGDIQALGPASDVFCLGLILFEVVNLERAYPRGSLRRLLTNMGMAKLRPMTDTCVSGAAARELGAIIGRACALAPSDRYPSAEALAGDVRRFLRGEEVSAHRDGALQRIARWVGHHRETTLLMVAALVLVAAGAVVWTLHSRQQALVAAEAHEDAVANLVTTVAERAQDIERHFLGFEAIVEGIAAAAANLVLHGRPGSERVYTNDDMSTPGRSPDDLADSPAYGRPVSLDWSVNKIAPDVPPQRVTALMHKVGPLRHHFKQTLFESVAGTSWVDDEAGVRRRILDQGAALTWAYVGLADGLHVAYPGKGGYPAEYDPRERPWYRYSADNQGTAWLSPYVDVSGRGLVVPCTRPLRRADGTLIGVAGVEMTLDHVRENLLDLSGRAGIRATYLVDNLGQVVSGSGDTPARFAAGSLIADLADLEPYPDQAVVDAVLAARSGHVTRMRDGEEHVIVFQRLGSVRWYLVAEAVVAH